MGIIRKLWHGVGTFIGAAILASLILGAVIALWQIVLFCSIAFLMGCQYGAE